MVLNNGKISTVADNGMEYRKLGNSGLDVSLLGFGFWVANPSQMPLDLAKGCIKIAYEKGVNFFDNAEIYANGYAEEVMGKAISELDLARDTIVISTKVFFSSIGMAHLIKEGQPKARPTQIGLARKHIIEACHQSLKRIGVDYIDVFLCHRPDPTTPIEEVVRAMNTLIQQGKIFYWGTSEWSAQQIMEAYTVSKEHHLIAPICEQPQYNMAFRQKMEVEYKRLFNVFKMGTTIWSPLASGFLTGKYNNGIPEGSRGSLEGYDYIRARFKMLEGQNMLEKIKKLEVFAKSIGESLPNLAIAWCCKNPNVSTVLLGASKVEQLVSNLTALETYRKFDDKVMKEISEILDNTPTPMEFQ